MKASIFTSLASLAAFAAAFPADNVRRAGDLGHHVWSTYPPPYYPLPTGTGTSYPTGTAAPVPIPTGAPCCPVDGALVCNGPNLFGLCNFGSVIFQPVAAGTVCKDGQIVAVGDAACPVDGAVVCDGLGYYGICNFGSVVFQTVAPGTVCDDGEILAPGDYDVPTY